jgi:hypothetical protein
MFAVVVFLIVIFSKQFCGCSDFSEKKNVIPDG